MTIKHLYGLLATDSSANIIGIHTTFLKHFYNKEALYETVRFILRGNRTIYILYALKEMKDRYVVYPSYGYGQLFQVKS